MAVHMQTEDLPIRKRFSAYIPWRYISRLHWWRPRGWDLTASWIKGTITERLDSFGSDQLQDVHEAPDTPFLRKLL